MEETYIISTAIKKWIVEHKKQLIISFVLICIGIIAINQYLSVLYKIDLLMHPCELCSREQADNLLRFNFSRVPNITLKN
jgi:hypothetical protein